MNSDKIILSHKEATLKRVAEQKIILCVQDTTIVDYGHRKGRVEGLGKLQQERQQGFLLHPTIAFSYSGLYLGVMNYTA